MIEFYFKNKHGESFYKNYKNATSIAGEIWEILLEQSNGEIFLHREDGPAIIETDENGNITLEWFYIEGNFAHSSIIYPIMKCKKKEQLIEYLLDNNKTIRNFAEYRLKQLI